MSLDMLSEPRHPHRTLGGQAYAPGENSKPMGCVLPFLVLVSLVDVSSALKAARPEPRDQKIIGDDAGMRSPSRGSAFDTTDSENAAEGSGSSAGSGVAEASPEWQAASGRILGSMRRHLEKRRKREEADLIGENRGLIKGTILGVFDFLRSKYFRNVRKSLGFFIAAWLWYVLNTKTYVAPEFDD